MISQEDIIKINPECALPLGIPDLDDIYDKYDEGSPRDDYPAYYRLLYKLAPKIETFVELGCHYGYASLHVMRGNHNAKVYGVDLADRVKSTVKNNPNFSFFQRDSADCETVHEVLCGHLEIDVLFIDSDHSYLTTQREFELWMPHVMAGGVVLFDDIFAPEYAEGCGKFFRELHGDKIFLPNLHPDNWGFGAWFKL